MTRIKIVPNSEPNAEGEWIEVDVDFPPRTRWRQMESLLQRHIPERHHPVAIEKFASVKQGVIPLKS